ncbi:T9SS type A sorting domain-containing protein [Psychroserpens mesophilus]|uniref:T9SS type A sorting domain-containing protein n=1 Tax=Psychroserpens mesophilus TaxID=325473 RepID=UPI003D64CF6D
MKKHYTMKAILFLGLLSFTFQQAYAQFRIIEVDPVADTVTIKSFDASTQNIGAYRLCSLFGYRTLSSQTTVVNGSLDLAPNAEVTLSAPGFLNDTAADLGLYLPTGSFGSAASMVDFTQWGSGGNGRENVAVTKGIWTANTFISAPPPYEYIGNGAQNGFQFWDTLLGINDFNRSLGIHLYPNPTHSILHIEFNSSETNLTLEVFDILGKQVLNRITDSEGFSNIDVSNLENGLYLIKIVTGDKTETKRFIKN